MLITVSGTSQTTNLSSVEDTLKDFWASRPRRPRSGRKVAGVAAGLGNRYGIDPVVIRVALVVATFFGGFGAMCYLLGWLLLPEDGDETSPLEALFGNGRSSTSRGFTVLLCIGLLPTSGFALAGSGEGFIGLLLVVAAVFLLHRSRGHLRRPVPTVQEANMQAPMNDAGAQATAQEQRPDWDPLGAAPLAWDLPDLAPPPSPPQPPPPPRPKTKIGPATVGIALLTGVTGAVLNLFGVPWFSAAHIIGLVLGVVGVGMVAGAFAGGGRGLIALALPLSVAGLLLTWVGPQHFGGTVGDVTATPTTLRDVRPMYEVSAGQVRLDLTRLPDSGTVRTGVRAGAGDVRIILPRTADVDVTCHSNVGAMRCLDWQHDGLQNTRTVRDDNGPDGKGGLKVILNTDVALGNLVVERG